MPVIFVSYRRSDSQDVAGRIYDRLIAKFTRNQIFKDVDNIPLGVSFPLHLQQMLGKANVVLVIIGPTWTTAMDSQGRRRLDDPNDFVRVEVEAALRGNIPVIPILVSNAAMPQTSDLPKSMQALASRNGMAVRPDPDFNNDIERLFSGLGHLESLLIAQAIKRPEGAKGVLSGARSADEAIKASANPTMPVEKKLAPGAERLEIMVDGDEQEHLSLTERKQGNSRLLLWFLVVFAGGGVLCLCSGVTFTSWRAIQSALVVAKNSDIDQLDSKAVKQLDKDKGDTNVKVVKPAISVTAEELTKEYFSAEKEALAKYKEMVVEVTGTIMKANDGKDLTLKGSKKGNKGALTSIVCNLAPGEQSKMATLAKDMQVRVVGTITRSVGLTLELSDCRLAEILGKQ